MQDSKFDDFAEEVRVAGERHYECGVAAMLGELSDADAAKVRAVIEDRRVTSTAIHTALKKRLDDPPSAYTIQRHRRSICRCRTGETK